MPNNKITIEEAEQNLKDKLIAVGSTLVPDMNTFTFAQNKMQFNCTRGHNPVLGRYCDVVYKGKKCKECSNEDKPVLVKPIKIKKVRTMLTPHDRWNRNHYSERINNSCPNLIPDIDTFTTRSDVMKMHCTLCNTDILKRPGDVISGMNCGNCFGVGFNKAKKANLYILKIEHEGKCIAYKVGITNKSAIQRCNWINKSTSLVLTPLYEYSSAGDNIKYIESELKKLIPAGGYIPRDVMKDGFTETFSGNHISAVLHLLFKLT
ncbi:hypothetical protein [Serratia marcescens]|uniref:hypothetical protein n=1 Tax=Serratia marcescens TaxID=615 RepID=UPI0013DCFD4F|nr:hypothetical protein [Serratia marcescens]WLS21444.1 hypothetical protein RAA91_09890 [Serratia marcescens]HCB1444855.1 hypothetical protein [Serratia marcescens]HCB1482348.1 hypothetical protein [Serratia marcescens]HCB1611881.1 hypothetical protein [Serratia marcescens]HCB1617154.1 hypothetical protein [Serratia marcescens]